MKLAGLAQADAERTVPRRIFNIFRLVVAGLFVVAGEDLGLGEQWPEAYLALALGYAAFAFLSGFPFALALGDRRLVALQFAVDFVVLVAMMAVSGGHGSGIAGLMMVYVAGAGVLVEGRLPLFFASIATLLVLAENTWRALTLGDASDTVRVGIVCIAFFAIALTTRLLAKRARTHETIAEARGEALGRQQAINERIIEDMHDGVLVFGQDGRLLQINPRATELLGPDLEAGTHMPALDAAVAACRESGSFDSMQLPLGPDSRPMRCRALLAHTAGEGGGDVLVYLTDYADVQKQIQQQKLAALGRLTASMAHEIRNPLSAVTQAAELLGEEKRAEVQERLVRIIGDNARRIERMVRDVLALGRRDEVVREALPLAPALSAIVEELTLAGEAERALYALDVPDEAVLWIDRAHLHQIVVNLLANARRYCSGAGGAIRIFTQELPGERTALHIVDDGPGVAPEQREQVFEPFATSDPKGTGLGLYIARELADANGAQLELVADAGGAHFVLSGRRTP